MKLHEYQAKQILQELGVCIPRQIVAFSPKEAETAADDFPEGCVVKAQIHSGGRGKAGGVRVCNTPNEVFKFASSMIGSKLVTKQTGSEGLPVYSVLLTEKLSIENELYLAITVDTNSLDYVVIASRYGGMEIEELAITKPEQILQIHISDDLKSYHTQYLSDKLNLNSDQRLQLQNILISSLTYMKEKDVSLIEINPLVSANKHLIAADAKIIFDDNALYRQHDIAKLEDLAQINPLEEQARRIGLSYVKLDGNIACLVNGAGLAMATMDVVKNYGGSPANFMDVGGGVGTEKVVSALELIKKDKDVTTIFVNIFGGIVHCDVIAEGIVQAIKKTNISVPFVVRLRGTNEEEGKAILNNAGLRIISIDDFTEATKTAISCAKGDLA